MATLYSYALTSVADVKESLGITDSSKDNLIIRKINQATDAIEGYAMLSYGHHFAKTTYTNEEYDGTGSNQLSLKMRPLITLTSFQARNTTVNQNDWSDIDSDLYFTDLGAGVIDLLFTQSLNWNRYRVTYDGGFDPIPADLAEASVMLASYLVDNASTGGASIKKKQEGSRSIEYFQPTTGQGSGNMSSIINSLGIDDMLSRYINYQLLEDK